MAYVNYDGYKIEKDPLAPKSLFENGGGGGGGGGADLPTGTDGQILINKNGTWESADPPFITKIDADATYAKQAQITEAVDAEKAAREAADATINETIKSQATLISNNTTLIGTETSDRKAADTAINERIDTIDSNVTSNMQAIADEEAARASADAALGKRIDDEATARSTKDEEIVNNLTTLQSKVDSIKGVPTGGTEGQFLRVDAAGNPAWETLPDADTIKY